MVFGPRSDPPAQPAQPKSAIPPVPAPSITPATATKPAPPEPEPRRKLADLPRPRGRPPGRRGRKPPRQIDPRSLPPLDPDQRYTVPEAIAYLRSSRASVYALIARGELLVIKAGRRTFVPGSELVRLSSLPRAA